MWELNLTTKFPQEIANKAIERVKLVRGLRSIIEETMLDVKCLKFQVKKTETVQSRSGWQNKSVIILQPRGDYETMSHNAETLEVQPTSPSSRMKLPEIAPL